MIAITGVVNGKVYEDEIIPAETLVKVTGLKLPNNCVFRLAKSRSSYDSVNKIDRYPNMTYLPNEFTGMMNNGLIKVVYFNRESKRGNNTVRTVDGKNKIVFKGRQMVVNPDKNYELAVFLCLHNSCSNSPIRDDNSTIIYELTDSEFEIRKRLAEEKTVLDYKRMVMESPHQVLLQKAYSMKVKSKDGSLHKITDPSSLSESELKIKMMELIDKNSEDFMAKWDDPENVFVSSVYIAIEMGLITGATKGQTHVWSWGNSGEEICRVQFGTEPVGALIAALDKNKATVIRMVNDSFKEEQKNVDKYKDYTAEELLQEAINKGAIEFNEELNKVVGKNGDVLKKVKVRERWEDEFKNALNVGIIRTKVIKILLNDN